MFSRWVQWFLALIALLFSAAGSWYEGSSILEDPWEWRYSTPFSQIMEHGPVEHAGDISGLDFFVYAAKFNPFFPSIMLISFIYLLVMTGLLFLYERRKGLAIYLAMLGMMLLLLGISVFGLATLGGKLCFSILLLGVFVCFMASGRIFKNMIEYRS